MKNRLLALLLAPCCGVFGGRCLYVLFLTLTFEHFFIGFGIICICAFIIQIFVVELFIIIPLLAFNKLTFKTLYWAELLVIIGLCYFIPMPNFYERASSFGLLYVYMVINTTIYSIVYIHQNTPFTNV